MADSKSSHSKHCSRCSSPSRVDTQKRKFLRTSMQVLGCVGVACALVPFISSLKPNRRTLAAAGPVTVDLSRLQPGEQLTVTWRGKPIWVIRRTPEMIAQLKQPNSALRDPMSWVTQQPAYAQNPWRSLRPEYLVLVGVCTHLGCSPQYKQHDSLLAQDVGGFYCPCHGSRFDLAGRVYQHVPAPINLEVPPYQFIDDHTLIIGDSV